MWLHILIEISKSKVMIDAYLSLNTKEAKHVIMYCILHVILMILKCYYFH